MSTSYFLKTINFKTNRSLMLRKKKPAVKDRGKS